MISLQKLLFAHELMKSDLKQCFPDVEWLIHQLESVFHIQFITRYTETTALSEIR